MSQLLGHEENQPNEAKAWHPEATPAIIETIPEPSSTRDDSAVLHEWFDDLTRPRPLPPGPVAAVTAFTLLQVAPWIRFLQNTQFVYQLAHSDLSTLTLRFGGALLFPAILFGQLLHTHRVREDVEDDALLGPLDPRWIGPFIDALDAPNRRVRRAASRQLVRLLSRLTPEDAVWLSPAHRRMLYAHLHRNPAGDYELTAAILKAIRRLKDREAIELVEQIAGDRRLSARRRYLRQVAADCRASLLAVNGFSRGEHLPRPTENGPSPSVVETLEPQTIQAEPFDAEAAARQRVVDSADAEVRELIAELEEQRRKTGQPGMRKAFLAASWLTIVPYTGTQMVLNLRDHDMTAGTIWAFCLLFATQLHRYALSSQRSQAAQRLAVYDNVQAVGVLVDMLEWPDPELQRLAKPALTRLLPRVQASDARLLTADRRAVLGRHLVLKNAARDRNFLCAILMALEQVGDLQDLPAVQRIADAPAYLPAQRPVKEAAQRCLPFLTIRANQQRASQTLLRASGADSTDLNVLLRPAEEASTSDPQQLLRADLSR